MLKSTKQVYQNNSGCVETILYAVNASNTLHAPDPDTGASMVSEAHSYGSDLLNQPFELTALEVALKEICQSYAASEKQLEAVISPACDALLKKVRVFANT